MGDAGVLCGEQLNGFGGDVDVVGGHDVAGGLRVFLAGFEVDVAAKAGDVARDLGDGGAVVVVFL